MFTVTLPLISFRLILSYNCCQAAATAANEHHEARFLPRPKAQNHLSIRHLVWITLEHKRCHLSQHEGRKDLKESKKIFLWFYRLWIENYQINLCILLKIIKKKNGGIDIDTIQQHCPRPGIKFFKIWWWLLFHENHYSHYWILNNKINELHNLVIKIYSMTSCCHFAVLIIYIKQIWCYWSKLFAVEEKYFKKTIKPTKYEYWILGHFLQMLFAVGKALKLVSDLEEEKGIGTDNYKKNLNIPI